MGTSDFLSAQCPLGFEGKSYDRGIKPITIL